MHVETVKHWEKVGAFRLWMGRELGGHEKVPVWVGQATNGKWYGSDHDDGAQPKPESDCDEFETRADAVATSMELIAYMNKQSDEEASYDASESGLN